MANTWPFDDPPNVAVITTKRITRKGYPILYVVYDDGEWQFLDGFDCTEADASVVGLQSMVDRDASLMQLADLPSGWYAERADVNAAWVRAKILTDE